MVRPRSVAAPCCEITIVYLLVPHYQSVAHILDYQVKLRGDSSYYLNSMKNASSRVDSHPVCKVYNQR